MLYYEHECQHDSVAELLISLQYWLMIMVVYFGFSIIWFAPRDYLETKTYNEQMNSLCIVRVDFRFKNGVRNDEYLPLLKSNNEWQIHSSFSAI